MSDIIFKEETHQYFVDGVERPSVTTIIHNIIPIYDKSFKKIHSDRGKAVHLACQYLEEGTLDWKSVHPIVLPYVKAWEKFLLETKCRSLSMEKLVYNPKLLYTGTLDREVELFGKHGVLDIKSGNYITGDIQTAGYDLALAPEEKYGRYGTRWVVSLNNKGKYKLIPFANKEDYDNFRNIVGSYYYKRRKNL